MKKTILLTFMLAGMTSAATTFTLDTAIVKTNDGSKVSAFEAALNKTATQANAVAGIAGAGNMSYKDTNTPTITFTVGDMFIATTPSGDIFQLSTLTFLSRNNNADINYGSLTLSVTGKTGEGTTATSSKFTIDSSQGTSVFRAVTWTFNSPLVFTMNDTLSLEFTHKATGNPGAFGMGGFAQETGYTYGGNNKGLTSSGTDYYNFFRLGANVIPEPTTATLSLLALVGLAARRRRK